MSRTRKRLRKKPRIRSQIYKRPKRARSVPRVRLAIGAVLFLLMLTLAVAWWRRDSRNAPDRPVEPFFTGLGTHTRNITTTSTLAQRYFDQGLAFLYGFNHEEAIRSFEAAAACDPLCAMAYWGIAMANGPDINNMNVNSVHASAAWQAAARARELSSNATPVERALIEAVSKRYAEAHLQDRKSLDQAYAAAMQEVWRSFPDDSDVGALTAEARIDLRPWNQWTRDGKPQPGTEELLQILDRVLLKSPMHPFALHLLIHAVEEGPHPEKADGAADRLRSLTPGLEHMLHMPSHIDVRRGRWQQAVIANEKAIAAEKAYRQIVPRGKRYEIAMGHNHHTLAFAAMMQGQSRKATDAIREMLAEIPEDAREKQSARLDGFFAMPYEVHLRFGHWDAMLAEPAPERRFPIATALWHYARGVAFAAKKNLDQAKIEQKAFLTAEADAPEKSFFRKTPAATYLCIAEKMLAGEILYREGKSELAIVALREATAQEDSLHFTEPPNWIVPVRHALGATLMDARRYREAEQVYREDLVRHPENGWSLYGLARSLRMQKRSVEAATVALRFKEAWQSADFEISSSCCCLPAAE
jgi:tetratricopeptide (TPR) repeat protein